MDRANYCLSLLGHFFEDGDHILGHVRIQSGGGLVAEHQWWICQYLRIEFSHLISNFVQIALDLKLILQGIYSPHLQRQAVSSHHLKSL